MQFPTSTEGRHYLSLSQKSKTEKQMNHAVYRSSGHQEEIWVSEQL